MRCLDEFMQRDLVREIVERCRKSPSVQGINIRLDPRWLLKWRMGERHDPYDPRRGYSNGRSWDWYPWQSRRELAPWIPIRPPMSHELDWKPDGLNNPLPIVVTIRLFPMSAKRIDPPGFNLAEENFQLVYEACPIARLYAGPKSTHRPVVGGLSIGVNHQDVGTLGGILKDQSGKFFGTTCGHVAAVAMLVDQPAQSDGGGGASSIGSVLHSETPPPFPSWAPATQANQSSYAGRVDAAVFEISGATAKQEVLRIGPISGIVRHADLEQDHQLEMTGRTSKWKVLQYGGLTPYHNLYNQTTGETYCYENPLMLRDSTGKRPVKEGDSGAWVCAPVERGYAWAGMVVGGDGQVGFAVEAEATQSWLQDPARALNLTTI
jgi:hypothetical protein